MASSNPLKKLVTLIWGDWQTNQTWQRIVKYSVACTLAFIIAILPSLASRATFLIPMVIVFAHPGQRMGLMIEALLMILIGSFLGLVWSMLGLYLAHLVTDTNRSAAYTIRGIFLVLAVLLHGILRSSSPRLFNFVLFMLVAVLTTLEVPTNSTVILFTNIYVPVLIGGAILLVINLTIFPELSSSHLGTSTITSISEAVETLNRATHWFITPGGDGPEARGARLQRTTTVSTVSQKPYSKRLAAMFNFKSKRWQRFLAEFPNPFSDGTAADIFLTQPLSMVSLATLTDRKTNLRSRLRNCKAVQNEVNFEISLSSLPPASMKLISNDYMTNLVQEVVTVIGACENKFILLVAKGGPSASDTSDGPYTTSSNTHDGSRRPRAKQRRSRIDDVKPVREIESGNAELLESILTRIREPVLDCQEALKNTVETLIACLAFCMDVSTLPSGERAPKNIVLGDIDSCIDRWSEALQTFDAQSAAALKRAARDQPGQSLDFTPRMETFLICSFLLAFRQAGSEIMHMTQHIRDLVEVKQNKRSKLFVWLPTIVSIRQWLETDSDSDATTAPEPSSAMNTAEEASPSASETPTPRGLILSRHSRINSYDEEVTRTTTDSATANNSPEASQTPHVSLASWLQRQRQNAADAIEWVQKSSDLVYAAKLCIAVMLVSWPALVPSWNQWYTEVRGIWAPLQLVLVFELAIGTSFIVFFVRLFGVVLGGVVGYLPYEIARGNRVGITVVLLFGIIPSIYIQLTTKYVKAGMISIVSMTVVALATVDSDSPGYEVFYKRLVAFLIGGLAAMLIEIILYPVRARDKLIDSLNDSVRYIEIMQAAVAVGIDHPERPDFRSKVMHSRFNRARNKAQASLNDAETYLPFCLAEPRLKGSFKPLAPIYAEIIYVLHQIIDRMVNVVQLRRAYGSSILEDLNSKVHTHRRNVAGSCTLILFSISEALTTWLPLPQFLPSARLAQLRLVNRVREILGSERARGPTVLFRRHFKPGRELDESTAKVLTQRKFLAWNAASSGQMEIIEYLEELIDLVKLLVGVNAFQSGLLETPTYKEYMRRVEAEHASGAQSWDADDQAMDVGNGDIELGTRGQTTQQSHATTTHRARAATIGDRSRSTALQVLQRETQDGNDDDTSGNDDNMEDIPLSLQRVGTRLRRENAVARKRAFTTSNTQR